MRKHALCLVLFAGITSCLFVFGTAGCGQRPLAPTSTPMPHTSPAVPSPTGLPPTATPVVPPPLPPVETLPLTEGNLARRYTLQIEDTPHDLLPDTRYTGPVSREALAASRPDVPDLARRLDEWGYREGYRAVYRRAQLDDPVGILMVQSWALVFESAEGAADFFAFLSDQYDHSPLTVERVSVPPLADEQRGYRLVRALEGQQWTVYLILMRRGNVVVSLDTTARSVTVFDVTLDYARIVARRLPAP